MKQRPQFSQVVFQRRAAQAQALACNQFTGRLRRFTAGIFDVLRFIENQQVQRQFCQVLKVFGQQGIRGEDEVVIVERLEVFFATGPVQCQHL